VGHPKARIPMSDSSIESLRISGSSKQIIRVFNLAEWLDVLLVYWVTAAPSEPVGWATIINELQKNREDVFFF